MVLDVHVRLDLYHNATTDHDRLWSCASSYAVLARNFALKLVRGTDTGQFSYEQHSKCLNPSELQKKAN